MRANIPHRDVSSNIVSQSTATSIGEFFKADTSSGYGGQIKVSQEFKNGELEELIFNSLSAVKRLTALASPHLDAEWRKDLFAQLDLLHDIDEWQQHNRPVNLESYSAFLFGLMRLRPKRRPSIGIDLAGNITAIWFKAHEQAACLFYPSGAIDWSAISSGTQKLGTSTVEHITGHLDGAGALKLLG